MVAARESKPWNALKFRTSCEVNSKEGVAIAEGLLLPPPNCSEVGAHQVELDGAVGEALILQPLPQRPRTKPTLTSMIHFWTEGVTDPVALLADISEIVVGCV